MYIYIKHLHRLSNMPFVQIREMQLKATFMKIPPSPLWRVGAEEPASSKYLRGELRTGAVVNVDGTSSRLALSL